MWDWIVNRRYWIRALKTERQIVIPTLADLPTLPTTRKINWKKALRFICQFIVHIMHFRFTLILAKWRTLGGNLEYFAMCNVHTQHWHLWLGFIITYSEIWIRISFVFLHVVYSVSVRWRYIKKIKKWQFGNYCSEVNYWRKLTVTLSAAPMARPKPSEHIPVSSPLIENNVNLSHSSSCPDMKYVITRNMRPSKVWNKFRLK